MRIILSSDHAGFELKKKIYSHLKGRKFDVIDYGPDSYDPNDDYPDFVAPVAEEVSENSETRGIVVGGSGEGEAIVANRFPRVRAAVFYGGLKPKSDFSPDLKSDFNVIKMSREHNDANVLSLGARFLSDKDALRAVDLWLETQFSGDERHMRRIQKIDELRPGGGGGLD